MIAVRASDGMTVQVPVKDGRTAWTAAEGEWTVYVVEHAFRTSPTRSDTNPKRVKDGSQSLEDYLDPAATAQYLAFTHEAYKRAVGDEFGKTIMGFRGDEPDYSISGLPWTPKLFAKFEAMKGYDVRPYVAVFLQGRDAVLTPEQLRVRADYYDVFADMFRDGFFKPKGEWCAANGLEYQVHLNHEEMQIQLAHSEGDFFRAMQFVGGAGDRYDMAPDMDGYRVGFSAVRFVGCACVWASAGVYGELCGLPAGAGHYDGAVHHQRADGARREPGGDDVLSGVEHAGAWWAECGDARCRMAVVDAVHEPDELPDESGASCGGGCAAASRGVVVDG